MGAAPRKKSLVGIGLSLGLLGLVCLAFFYRREIELEWWGRKAARDCVAPGFDRTSLPRSWRELLEAREKGFPHLLRLLRDPEYEVWKTAVDLADHDMEEKVRVRFVEHLRRRDPCASILYLIAPRDQRALDSGRADWRDAGDTFDRGYWTGSGETALAPASGALAFLKEVLAETPASGEASGDTSDFKQRAIHALAAMEEAPDVTRLLAWSANNDRDPEVRLRALQALVFRSGGTSWEDPPRLTDWEAFSLNGTTGRLMPRAFLDHGSLRALVHLDHPRVLLVLARLQGMSQVRPFLDQVLSADQQLCLPLPNWLPLSASCGRFLKGALPERTLAMLAASELPAAEGRPVLEKALAAESDSEMRLLGSACLLSLGDESRRGEVRDAFEKRMVQPGMVLLPAGVLLLRGIYRQWDEVVRRLANGYRADGWDLGVLLARSGDREALEQIVLRYTEYSIRQGYALNLETVGALFLDGAPPYSRSKLREWWDSFKDRIRFDPDRRRFVVPQDS